MMLRLVHYQDQHTIGSKQTSSM